MNEELPRSVARPLPIPEDAEASTLGMSSVYRLFEAFIALRENNAREHKMFEQTLTRARDSLQDSFNTFAAQTQKAYQQLRQEMQSEKKIALTLLNDLLDLALDLNHVVASRPSLPEASGPALEPVRLWMEGLQVQNRKVQDSLSKHGIHTYDAVVGMPYNPALHERVGSKRVEGMDALRVAEQIQQGFRQSAAGIRAALRPKIIVTD